MDKKWKMTWKLGLYRACLAEGCSGSGFRWLRSSGFVWVSFGRVRALSKVEGFGALTVPGFVVVFWYSLYLGMFVVYCAGLEGMVSSKLVAVDV